VAKVLKYKGFEFEVVEDVDRRVIFGTTHGSIKVICLSKEAESYIKGVIDGIRSDTARSIVGEIIGDKLELTSARYKEKAECDGEVLYGILPMFIGYNMENFTSFITFTYDDRKAEKGSK
jgi:hypothetical protein